MIYVYGIAEDLTDVADLTGILGEPLTSLPYGHARVVVGEVSARPIVDPEALRAQDALVRVLHTRARALLPMRFGTVNSDRDELRRLLDTQERLLSRLAAVRGCEQMVVRVLGTQAEAGPSATTARTGTAYLRERARRLQPAPALESLAQQIGSLARDVKIEAADQPGLLGAIYHLIERGRGDEYRDAVHRIVLTLPAVRVLVSGPSPPYAFA